MGLFFWKKKERKFISCKDMLPEPGIDVEVDRFGDLHVAYRRIGENIQYGDKWIYKSGLGEHISICDKWRKIK